MNLEEARRLTIQKQTGTELDIAPKISGGWNVAKNMRSSPYAPFESYDEEDEWGFGVEEDGQGFFYPIPRIPFDERVQNPNEMMMAHHTGGKHFTEPTVDELIQGIINGEVPRGTLGDEETENRMIQEYLQRQDQAMNNMMIAGAPYSLNPQRMMMPSGRMEYAPLNLRSDDQKIRQHMMIYGGKWDKPI